MDWKVTRGGWLMDVEKLQRLMGQIMFNIKNNVVMGILKQVS